LATWKNPSDGEDLKALNEAIDIWWYLMIFDDIWWCSNFVVMVDLMDKNPYVIESIYGKNGQKWLIFDGLPWFTNFIVMLWYGYVSPNQGLPNFRGSPVVTNGFHP
jgi:hypothetical protein